MTYRKRDEIQLSWMDNRDQVTLAIRQICRRIQNEVLSELDRQFYEAVNRGEILELGWDTSDLKQLFRKIVERELGPAKKA